MIAVREFTNGAEIIQHRSAVRARLFSPVNAVFDPEEQIRNRRGNVFPEAEKDVSIPKEPKQKSAWKQLDADGKADAVRSAWFKGCTAKQIADTLGILFGQKITRASVMSAYFRRKEMRKTHPLSMGSNNFRKQVTYRGKQVYVNELARLHGVSAVTIRRRISRGWSVEAAVETPVDLVRQINGKRSQVKRASA